MSEIRRFTIMQKILLLTSLYTKGKGGTDPYGPKILTHYWITS